MASKEFRSHQTEKGQHRTVIPVQYDVCPKCPKPANHGSNLEDELQKLKEELEKKNKTISNLSFEYNDVMGRLKKEELESKRLKSEYYKLESELKHEESENQRLPDDCNRYASELNHGSQKQVDQRLREENDQLRHNMNKVSTLNSELKSEIDQLRSSTAKHGSQKQVDQRLRDEYDQLRHHMEKVSTLNSELKSEIDRLRSSTPKHGSQKQVDQSLMHENDQLRSDLNQASILNSELISEVNRLRTSLSRVAGEKMSEDNPFIADLSDPNRPQRLTEKFNSLYDNSWTDAYEILTSTNGSEKQTCQFLLDILKSCWEYCSSLAQQQLYDIMGIYLFPVSSQSQNKMFNSSASRVPQPTKLVKESRRSVAAQFIPNLCEHYWKAVISKDISNNSTLHPYVNACLELCWYSAISDPPLDYSFTVEKRADFKGYTKSGNEVDFVVWPAMYLNRNGPLLYQGVVQFKQT